MSLFRFFDKKYNNPLQHWNNFPFRAMSSRTSSPKSYFSYDCPFWYRMKCLLFTVQMSMDKANIWFYKTHTLNYTLISPSHHVEIESEAPMVRNPDQPGSAATTTYEPRCETRRHVCFFFLYFTVVGIRGDMFKTISCISESAQQLDRGLNHPWWR